MTAMDSVLEMLSTTMRGDHQADHVDLGVEELDRLGIEVGELDAMA